MSRRRQVGAIGLAAAMLAACSGPLGPEGDPSPGAAKRARCDQGCNRDYDRCADSAGARRGSGGSFFGMGAACDRQVKDCLAACKALVAEPKKPAEGEGGK